MNFSLRPKKESDVIIDKAYDALREVQRVERNTRWELENLAGRMKREKDEMGGLLIQVKKEAAESKERVETLQTLVGQLLEKNKELEERLVEVEGIKDDLLNLAELAKN